MKRRALTGAFAGALGGIAMKAIVEFVDRNSFGLSSATDARTIHEICRVMNWQPVSDKRAEQVGAALHYGFAIAAGVGYAMSSEAFPVIRLARGGAFGAALWLVGDEVTVSAARLEDPFKTPLFSHVSALGAHVLYGLILEALTGGNRE